jgi:hypothetical protein
MPLRVHFRPALPVDASFLKGSALRSFSNSFLRAPLTPGVVHFEVLVVFSRVPESVSDPSQLAQIAVHPSLPSATTSLSISNCRGGRRWPPSSVIPKGCAPVEVSVSSLDEDLFVVCKLPSASLLPRLRDILCPTSSGACPALRPPYSPLLRQCFLCAS